MNKIIITGRMCKDAEIKVTDSGREFTNFSVAVDRRFKPKDGEKETDFFDLTAWGKTAAFINKFFHKGDGITVEGRMESRKYTDKDGNKRTFWGISCENVEFPLGGKKGNRDDNDGGDYSEPNNDNGFAEPTADDGDIPF